MNDLDELTAISPVDGRYFDVTSVLSDYFSEYAFFKTGLEIELKYFMFLSEIKIFRRLTAKEKNYISNIYTRFTIEENRDLKRKGAADGLRIHDVKSIEYYIRRKFESTALMHLTHWIHFGLTSYDINDNSYRLMVTRATVKVLLPKITALVYMLDQISRENAEVPMLGRTHGQAAVPTTFGKEMVVFSARIKKQLLDVSKMKLYGKFGGAVGNWNSLAVTYPEKDWIKISTKFLRSLGLEHTIVTTQIAPNEDLIEMFQTFQRVNSILLAFNQDMWRYISDNWIVQKKKAAMIGSSTMPQKVNPLEFENSEGNLVMANGIFDILCRKLPVSRLQRDLSDSTVLRNIGVAFAHSLIAYESCLVGLHSIDVNKEAILNSLNSDWSILSEALQSMLRKHGIPSAYEKIASKFRGRKITKTQWTTIIKSIKLSQSDKRKLLRLTPETYIGLAPKVVTRALKKS